MKKKERYGRRVNKEFAYTPTKSIDLEPMYDDIGELKFIRFDSIAYGSFLNVKARGLGEKNEYFNALMQLTLRNEIFVFNLDVNED